MRELYSELMREAPAHIVVTIDVQEPVELLDFVSMFTALANQYEKFMRVHHPDLDGEAKIFVRELRTGSIEADLIPWALAIISNMDRILIVEQFVRLYASRLKSYFVKDGRADAVTKSDLNDFMRRLLQLPMIRTAGVLFNQLRTSRERNTFEPA